MLPISKSKQAARPSISRARPEGERPAGAPLVPTAGSEDQSARDNAPLRPVGLERLKALREAIENGTYPTEEDVLGGLERLFEVDDE